MRVVALPIKTAYFPLWHHKGIDFKQSIFNTNLLNSNPATVSFEDQICRPIMQSAMPRPVRIGRFVMWPANTDFFLPVLKDQSGVSYIALDISWFVVQSSQQLYAHSKKGQLHQTVVLFNIIQVCEQFSRKLMKVVFEWLLCQICGG